MNNRPGSIGGILFQALPSCIFQALLTLRIFLQARDVEGEKSWTASVESVPLGETVCQV